MHLLLKGPTYNFAKKRLSVKQTTQNDFIYGELGRFTYQTKRCLNIIKYWVKILHKKEDKYIYYKNIPNAKG